MSCPGHIYFDASCLACNGLVDNDVASLRAEIAALTTLVQKLEADVEAHAEQHKKDIEALSKRIALPPSRLMRF